MSQFHRRFLGRLFVPTGLALIIAAGWATAQFRILTAQRPFFSAPFGIAVVEDGTIFVGANFGEIHAYAQDGTPIRGWTVPSSGGVFRLRVAEPGRLQVATARTNQLLTYDLVGELLDQRSDPEAFSSFGGEHDFEFATDRGAVFGLGSAGLVRMAPPPQKVLVPAPPLPLSLLGPQPILPFVLLYAAGSLGLVVGLVLSGTPRRAA